MDRDDLHGSIRSHLADRLRERYRIDIGRAELDRIVSQIRRGSPDHVELLRNRRVRIISVQMKGKTTYWVCRLPEGFPVTVLGPDQTANPNHKGPTLNQLHRQRQQKKAQKGRRATRAKYNERVRKILQKGKANQC